MQTPSHHVSASANLALLTGARRVVIKVGSTLLVDEQDGRLKANWLASLVDDVQALVRRGQCPLVVTSGAIAIGRRRLGLPAGRLKLRQSQAAAAVGQIELTAVYAEVLARAGLTAAQILLTLDDTEQRGRYLNARDTLETLLAQGAVPIINENDTVATAEIRYGDNDRLAARVAQLASAECLVLLSDVDALYDADPRRSKDARPIAVVTRITPELEQVAGSTQSAYGTGGMVTKLAAARIATAAGCSMVIASGRVTHPIAALEAGARCTWFPASASAVSVRKQWIASHLQLSGAYQVDAGAARALVAGKSLLPAGALRLDGSFERGDAVAVLDPQGREIGRGLSAYASAEAARLLGRHTSEIEAILGYRGREVLIHRDDLVLATCQDAADDS
ncbi:MAG: glutamate 5-kinase [Gammaproteobacteria bacterium]|nr:glutamate 5-kinase [Gammaproteobacteria bacterium]